MHTRTTPLACTRSKVAPAMAGELAWAMHSARREGRMRRNMRNPSVLVRADQGVEIEVLRIDELAQGLQPVEALHEGVDHARIEGLAALLHQHGQCLPGAVGLAV